MKRVKGLTLWELLIAVAIAGTALSVGAPALGDFIRDSRRAQQVNSFVHSLHLARSESAKRGYDVVLCPSSDGRNCSTGVPHWSDGWIVFVNLDGDNPPRVDAAENLLYVKPPVTGLTITANRNAFSYRPFGKRATNGTLIFCDTRGSADARAVIVSYTGRPRVAPRSAAGKPLPCP